MTATQADHYRYCAVKYVDGSTNASLCCVAQELHNTNNFENTVWFDKRAPWGTSQ